MKVWQLAYPHNLQHVHAPDLKRGEGEVKVKITKALISESDVAVYDGSLKVKAPFIPGRYAIGQVTEADENSFVKKGERVYLANITDDECAPDGKRIAGDEGWGYDNALESVDAYVADVDNDVSAVVSIPTMCGYCYTQLTDCYQETNGLLYMNREPKADIERLAAIFKKKP